MFKIKEGILLGLGNPLLDIVATVDIEFLEKYHLKPNDAILAQEIHFPMYQALVQNHEVEFVAGGGTLNGLRVAQWVMGTPNATTFMGAIGNDENGKVLTYGATLDGVNMSKCQIEPTEATGTCAVLITSANRSLCAYMGATKCFSKCHLMKPENWSIVEKSTFYYSSGFFIVVGPESLMAVGEFASQNNRPFLMNLSAPFIPLIFKDELLKILPSVDVLFGNEQEAEALAEALEFETKDLTEIALKMADWTKSNAKMSRIVIFTRGTEPVIVVKDKKVTTFPVIKISAEQIKDTNGAGDGFCGGFIAQFVQGKDLKDCVECGIWCATEVIQQIGCTFPKDKKYGK